MLQYLVIGFIIFLLAILLIERFRKKEKQTLAPTIHEDEMCCGKHEVCVKNKIQKPVGDKIEYYDDEELDAYKGISSDEYTVETVDQFREIFYSMQECDVPGWVHSLQLRGIELPDQLKDEVLLVFRN